MPNLTEPFIEKYTLIENFHEIEKIDDAEVELSGVAYKAPCGKILSGSAGSLVNSSKKLSTKDRAFFEFLERASVFEHTQKSETPQGETWKSSISNGVAIHTSEKEATASAYYEVIERDRVLRSWYTNEQPELRDDLLDIETSKLFHSYEFHTYRVPSHPGDLFLSFNCIMTVARHIKNNIYILGFGVADDDQQASRKSLNETIQRIGFLHGEVMTGEIDFSPSALYHQDFYLKPENSMLIENWLEGKNPVQVDLPPLYEFEEMSKIDITPRELAGHFHVIKVTSSQRVPLIFGKDYKILNSHIPASLEVHPIA